jgi:electron transport complex protein RnfB
MTEEVYKKLAQRLDTIPNGFPATESGVELKLLAKIFSPQEAKLASVMRLTLEPAGEIAARAGMDPDKAEEMLQEMARKGQIRARRAEGQLVFGLMPFVVGIYEEQLPRMNEELARLFEQYYQETRGSGAVGKAPAVHRVIPVDEAISFDLEVFPYERATELIENAKSWGVRKCICRVQQKLIGKGCDHPVENCILFAPMENAFDDSEATKPIPKKEALRLLHQAEEAGLVHSAANNQGQIFYICNCCTCCCGVIRGLTEFGNPSALARSDFRTVVDAEMCTGCGECVQRCSFGALSVPEEVCVVDYDRCVGCGLCASACPTEALSLERRPEGEMPKTPADQNEWMAKRAQERGIDVTEVL